MGAGNPIDDTSNSEVARAKAIAAYLRTPLLPSASTLLMADIAVLLHLLQDTSDRLSALSWLANASPPTEAAAIWARWAPHLAHEGVVFPGGEPTQDAFLRLLMTPITTMGALAETAELLRLFVTDKISLEALAAPGGTLRGGDARSIPVLGQTGKG